MPQKNKVIKRQTVFERAKRRRKSKSCQNNEIVFRGSNIHFHQTENFLPNAARYC